MSFSTHTFETNPQGHLGFAFHENISEGQTLYFLGKFSPDTVDPEVIAETIFGEVVDYFEQTPNKNGYDRFENALKTANIAVRKLAPPLEEVPEIIIAFFDFHHLYLAQSGGAEAYLFRDQAMSQITDSAHQEEDLFINILSGNVALDDIIIFTSNRILNTVPADQIQELLSQDSFSTGVADLRHELSEKSKLDTLVTVIGIGKKSGGISSAGFLSKVVSSGKALANNAKNAIPIGNSTDIEEITPENIPEKKSEDLPKDLPEENSEEIIEDNSKTEKSYSEEEEESKSSLPSRGNEEGQIIDQKTSRFKIKKPNINIPKINLPKIPAENKAKILGLLLLIIVLIIVVQLFRNYESDETGILRIKLDVAQEAFQQADAALLKGEREEAKTYLSKAEKAAQEILRSKGKDFRSDAQFLLADIQEKKLLVENATKSTSIVVADLGVKHDDFQARGILPLQGSIFVYDNKKAVKTIRNVVEKSMKIADGLILAATVKTAKNRLLFLTDKPRIVEYQNGLVTPMRTTDENWKTGLDIKTYSRYVYILDPVENQIWKYTRNRANYSGAVPYNDGADLSRAVSFAIDGGVYILSDDGSIQKIFRGKKVPHEFKNLPSVPFQGKNLKIFTHEELDFVYILDPENERILIFTKGDNFATYKKQVIFNLANVQDFIVETSGQKAQLITVDKVYEVQL